MSDLRKENLKLGMDARVDLFTVDTTAIGGTVYRFHSLFQTKHEGVITFDGIEYQPYPVQVTGMEVTSSGTKPKPTMTIANVDAMISGLVIAYDDLINAKVERVSTLRKFLDGEPKADPTAKYPPAWFYIKRKTLETRKETTFELGDPTELEGAKVPQRLVMARIGTCQYRGEGCGYSGDPIETFDETAISGPFVDQGEYDSETEYVAGDYVTLVDPVGTPHVFVAIGSVPAGARPPDISYWKADQCARLIRTCKKRNWPDNVLPINVFPGVHRLPTV